MPRISIIEAIGNKPKRIEEYVERVNTKHMEISVARMVSPPGWIEPGLAIGMRLREGGA